MVSFAVVVAFFLLGCLTGWLVWDKPEANKLNITVDTNQDLSTTREEALKTLLDLAELTAQAHDDWLFARGGRDILWTRYDDRRAETAEAYRAFKRRYGKLSESEAGELRKLS